jgi:hypothetical protein
MLDAGQGRRAGQKTCSAALSRPCPQELTPARPGLPFSAWRLTEQRKDEAVQPADREPAAAVPVPGRRPSRGLTGCRRGWPGEGRDKDRAEAQPRPSQGGRGGSPAGDGAAPTQRPSRGPTSWPERGTPSGSPNLTRRGRIQPATCICRLEEAVICQCRPTNMNTGQEKSYAGRGSYMPGRGVPKSTPDPLMLVGT